jgi:starch-binding outer membrane protein, SusD/RagB family
MSKPITSRVTHLMRIRNLTILAGAVALAACSESVVPDYNNLTEDKFSVLTTTAQLQQLATGIADVDRQTHDFQILLDETIARDVFRMDAAETRYITQPLGVGSMSNSVFTGQAVFNGPYRAIRSAQNLINATNAAGPTLTSGNTVQEFSDADKRATIGYAQTMKALEYMRLVEQRDTLGTSIYTTPTSLEPIQCKENVLELITALLDSADADLAAGGAFRFTLPSGFRSTVAGANFNTPTEFRKFNRALRAKAGYYQAFDLFARTAGADPAASSARTINTAAITEAEAALAASFYTPFTAANQSLGVFHTYSTASGDYTNPNFGLTRYRINPRVVREAEGTVMTVTGTDTTYTVVDQRIVNKVDLTVAAGDCVTVQQVFSCFQDKVNASNTDPLPIIRNDELNLIRAQLLWGRGQYQAALDIVNTVRAAAGLTTPLTLAGNFGGVDTAAEQDQLMLAILREKRNQLLFESASRFVDYRMFGYLNLLGKERGNDPIPVFPFPLAEVQARGGNTAQTCS